VPSEVTGIGGVERKPWAYHNKVTVKLTTPWRNTLPHPSKSPPTPGSITFQIAYTPACLHVSLYNAVYGQNARHYGNSTIITYKLSTTSRYFVSKAVILHVLK
jgi:hypothetical protein